MEEGEQTASSSKSPMMLIVLGIIVLVAIAAFILMKSQNKNAATTQQNTTTNTPVSPEISQSAENPTATAGASQTGTVQEFTVHGGMYYFKANALSVKKGDTVKIHFINDGGTHDLTIDEFDAKTSVIKTGETADVEFVADKAGKFQYYCSVGNHRQMGMVGALTVTE